MRVFFVVVVFVWSVIMGFFVTFVICDTKKCAYRLERVMAAFKIHGQLLLAEIEEKDDVYCPLLSGSG